MNDYGFIITRHVRSEKTNNYWINCVRCIKKFYPNKKIVIIDDNSDKKFLKDLYNFQNSYNIKVIESEFPGRGELLPYYYFLKHKFFNNAIIIHDSVFFHRRIHFEKINGVMVLPLWHFPPDKENYTNTLRISDMLQNNHEIQKKISLEEMILSLKHIKWYGCFGVQSFINHDFLKHIEQKYHITNMIKSVTCRNDRCSLERILGIIFFTEYNKLIDIKSVFGCIFTYQRWGYTFEDYQNDIKKNKISRPVIKVWTGR